MGTSHSALHVKTLKGDFGDFSASTKPRADFLCFFRLCLPLGEMECNRYAGRHDIGRRLGYHVTWSLVDTDTGYNKTKLYKKELMLVITRQTLELDMRQNRYQT